MSGFVATAVYDPKMDENGSGIINAALDLGSRPPSHE
jgi:hypothetical protein